MSFLFALLVVGLIILCLIVTYPYASACAWGGTGDNAQSAGDSE